VPGWHAQTKQLEKEGKLQVVGIIQEQHPDRAKLFMQWKQMGWPILVDSLNLLGVSAVPITLFIDEYGIVQRVRPQPEELTEFLEASYPRPLSMEVKTTKSKAIEPDDGSEAGEWRAFGDRLYLWGGDGALDSAIEAYRTALSKEDDAASHFRLGVALRRRYESEGRRSDDFKKAVESWGEALERDPNQYIWRRRIQQYGPRLTKPYPFYDWVAQARSEISARGETPPRLLVEPGGAEFASPTRDFVETSSAPSEPDPRGRIFRDKLGLVQAEVVSVPAALKPGEVVRVHVTFRPNRELKAHWNNEVEDLVFWVDPPDGWHVDNQHQSFPNPPEAISQEPRSLEFELQVPASVGANRTVSAYALYYVCEDVDGKCLYRRLDVALPVVVR
jgi:tetratricopeptide (TPR) repeat protein